MEGNLKHPDNKVLVIHWGCEEAETSRAVCRATEKKFPGRVQWTYITSAMRMFGPLRTDTVLEWGSWGKARWKIEQAPIKFRLKELSKEWMSKDWPRQVIWPPVGCRLVQQPGDCHPKWLDLVSRVSQQGWTPDKVPTLKTSTPTEVWKVPNGDVFPDPREREALTEFRVEEGGHTKWAPPEILATWKQIPIRGWREKFPCTAGGCGFGPYCSNCRVMWNWLEYTPPVGVADAGRSGVLPCEGCQPGRDRGLPKKRATPAVGGTPWEGRSSGVGFHPL